MENKKCIFIAFSLGNSSVSDYFLRLTTQLAQEFEVVIISDKKATFELDLPVGVQLAHWPSARPTHWRDFVFYYRLLKQYKPVLTLSMFGSVNISTLASWFAGVPLRVIWSRTISLQFSQKKLNHIRKKNGLSICDTFYF